MSETKINPNGGSEAPEVAPESSLGARIDAAEKYIDSLLLSVARIESEWADRIDRLESIVDMFRHPGAK